jgi:hypothetical protein
VTDIPRASRHARGTLNIFDIVDVLARFFITS